MKDGKLKLDAAIALIGQAPCGLNRRAPLPNIQGRQSSMYHNTVSRQYNSSKVNFQ